MRLQYNGFEVASVTCSGLTGQLGAAGHALAFFVRFQPKQIPNVQHVDTVATVLRDFRLRVSAVVGTKSMLLGNLTCLEQAFVRLDQYSFEDTKRFELLLSEGQLAAIEDARGAGGATFTMELFATALGNKGAEYTKADLQLERNVVDWTKLLADIGSTQFICVPVAVAHVGTQDVHAPAVKWLRSAQKYMLQGEYATAISECRHALDSLSRVTEEAGGADDTPASLREGRVLQAFTPWRERKSMTRAQRLVLVRMAVFHLTNIGHHQAEHPEQTLSREDASLVIASTAALLSASLAGRFDVARPDDEEQGA